MKPLDLSAMPLEAMLGREWLVTNHLGGFAASTVAGLNTRKYHGLLVAAMAPPVRRMVLLSRVEETVRRAERSDELACNEYPGVVYPQGHQFLRAFDLDPFPRWAYQGEGWTIEKQLQLVRGQNTVLLTYMLLGGDRAVDLELRPLYALRGIHELMYQWNGDLSAEIRTGHHRIPPSQHTPEVFFAHDGRFYPSGTWYLNTIYRREVERGYAGLEDLWMPGTVRWTLQPGQSVHFACSTEPIGLERAVEAARQQEPGASPHQPPPLPDDADEAVRQTLLRAAKAFIVRPPGPSDKATMVMAGYPWAGPSMRVALMSLPGLLLVPGRIGEARSLLESAAAALSDGLVPSEYPEDGSGPLYNGADTSLWFAHAAHEYLRYHPADEPMRRIIYDALGQIIRCYLQGTRLGIKAAGDGLIAVAEPGTSWMNATIDGRAVTPRTGMPVELNALWYNALCITQHLAHQAGEQVRARELAALADGVKEAFNRRFWNEPAGCCFDVICDDRADASIRPNQVFAVSLPFPVLPPDRQAKVLEKLTAELLTPHGLRTLSPKDRAYRGHYRGDAHARDSAYHQGPAYPWLLGPMVTATLRVHAPGDRTRKQAMDMIEAPLAYLHGQGMGMICELFDGEPPHHPGGAPASALAVAEILRCYTQDILAQSPPTPAPHPTAPDLLIVPPITDSRG